MPRVPGRCLRSSGRLACGVVRLARSLLFRSDMESRSPYFLPKVLLLVLGLLLGASPSQAHRAYLRISGDRADDHGPAVVQAVVKDASLRSATYRASSGTLVFKGSKAAVQAASARAGELLNQLNERLLPRQHTTVQAAALGHDWVGMRRVALDRAGAGALILSPTLLGAAFGYLGGNAAEGLKIGAGVNAALAVFLGSLALGNM